MVKTVKEYTIDELAPFHNIINEELKRGEITWAQLILGGMMRPSLRVRWAIIWRAYTELKYPIYRIATLLELDPSTVRNAVKNMSATNGEYFNLRHLNVKVEQRHRRKLAQIEARL